MNNQEKLEHLLEMVDKILEDCDNIDVKWTIRATWLNVVKDMCDEAIELIKKDALNI